MNHSFTVAYVIRSIRGVTPRMISLTFQSLPPTTSFSSLHAACLINFLSGRRKVHLAVLADMKADVAVLRI